MNGNKYLLKLIGALNERQLFFIGFGLIVGTFVFLMLRFQKRMTQRNFKEDPTRSTAVRNNSSTSVRKSE